MDDAAIASRDRIIAEQREMLCEQQRVIAMLQEANEKLQEQVERLSKRLRELEVGKPRGMPGNKTEPKKEPKPKRERRKRQRNFSRPRSRHFDVRVEHVVDRCPDCGTRLGSGSVWRTREVIEVPVVPRVVTQHVYIERACPMCSKRVKPKPELEGVVVGKSRLGVGLVSLIATLKEKLRLPIEQIQWYLQTFHKLHVSRGEIDYSLKRVVQVGHKQAEEVLNRVRASPVVNADETGWRESGSNGYVWTLSTPTERYFVRGNRSAQVLKALLGDFGGVLVSDFYAGYDCYEGYHQRCWVHLLRDLHELAHVHPQDEVKEWTNSVTKLYRKAKLYTGLGSSKRKEEARLYFERQLRQLYEPYLNNKGDSVQYLL